MFNPDKQIVVKTNKSNIIYKGVINHSDKLKRLYLIIFHSRKFSPTELNYNIYNKKLLTIVDYFK